MANFPIQARGPGSTLMRSCLSQVATPTRFGSCLNRIAPARIKPEGDGARSRNSARRRIVALMPVETAEAQKSQSQVILLENFFDEVRRKVPIGK